MGQTTPSHQPSAFGSAGLLIGMKVAYLGGAGELEADPPEGVPWPVAKEPDPLLGIPRMGGGAMSEARGSLDAEGVPLPPPPPGGPPPLGPPAPDMGGVVFRPDKLGPNCWLFTRTTTRDTP